MTTAPRRRFAATIVALIAIGALAGACSDPGPERTDAGAAPGSGTAAAPVAAPVRRSAGCGAPPAPLPPATPPGDVELPFPHGGGDRSYRLGVPAGYDRSTPAPVVLNLHGSGGTAQQQSSTSDLPARAGARGYLTVTPDAVARNWELAAEGPDRDFLDALLDHVEATWCVDLDRVHVIGMSLGAWKAALTACVDDRIASAALVTVEVHPPSCRALPVVAFHGTADRIVPYGEGADPGIVVQGPNAGLPGARVNMAGWAQAAGCATEPEERPIGDDVVHRVYLGCADGRHVELYTILHGDHTWPGDRSVPRPFATHTIHATDIALDWFAAHPRRAT